MAKHTTRDQIWTEALRRVEESPDEWFTPLDVQNRVGVTTSKRTIRDCLATMEESGFLASKGGKGGNWIWYGPPELKD